MLPRIRVEERALAQAFDADYTDYANSTARLLPPRLVAVFGRTSGQLTGYLASRHSKAGSRADYSSPSQYSTLGPGRASMIGSSATLEA
jgi:hypothetical protein